MYPVSTNKPLPWSPKRFCHPAERSVYNTQMKWNKYMENINPLSLVFTTILMDNVHQPGALLETTEPIRRRTRLQKPNFLQQLKCARIYYVPILIFRMPCFQVLVQDKHEVHSLKARPIQASSEDFFPHDVGCANFTSQSALWSYLFLTCVGHSFLNKVGWQSIYKILNKQNIEWAPSLSTQIKQQKEWNLQEMPAGWAQEILLPEA